MRLTWLASVVATALIAVMLLSVGGAAAKTPGWQFTDAFNDKIVDASHAADATHEKAFTGSPSTVGSGKFVAFYVELDNTGKSNISSVILTTDIAATNPMGNPVHIFDAEWTTPDGLPDPDGLARPCDAAPTAALYCDFGALNAGVTVKVKIVFQAPIAAGTQTFNFLANGNGNTPSDSGQTSHGDSLVGPASFTVSGSSEFDGGFVLDTNTTFSTDDTTLGKRNPQSSSVTTNELYYAATIEDSSSISGTDPCQASGVSCIGQWAKVTAPNPTSGPIKVVLLVYGKGIPGSVGPGDIVLYHVGGTDLE